MSASTAIQGAGVLISAYGAYSANKNANKASELQQNAQNQDLAFRQQQYGDWKNKYGSLESEMLNQANSDQPLNLGPDQANIQSNFDQAGRKQEAALARSGNLGSGYQRNSNLEIGRAMALSDAYSQGLQRRDALRERLYNASKQMPGQAVNLQGGYQNMAGLYGNQANQANSAAMAGWQGVGQGLSNMSYLLGQNSKTPQAGIPSADKEINNGSVPYTTAGTETAAQGRYLDSGIYNAY